MARDRIAPLTYSKCNPLRGSLGGVLSLVVVLACAAFSAAVPPGVARADSGWTAYNDCVWQSGQPIDRITTYGISSPTSGILVDQLTGNPTGVTASIAKSAGVIREPSSGGNSAADTDAYTTFAPFVDVTGSMHHATSDWWVELTLSGLDPAKTYTFATTANRNVPGYAGLVTLFTLSGVEAATNASTPGVISGGGYSVAFDTGYNTVGYVARWTDIQPGSDGEVMMRAEPNDSAVFRAYGFSVFMLQEEVVPLPNTPPTLTAIGDRTIAELATLAFTATATDGDTADTLTFSLENEPAGATIDASTGAFAWTPTEAQGPGTSTLRVEVCDSGTPTLCDDEQITVTVSEANQAPVLAAIGDRSVDELATLAFTASATDADVPANTLTFSLGSGAPDGAGITSGGGFSWTPTEVQGGHDYGFDVCVSDGTETVCETIAVTVAEVNQAPVLAPVGNQAVSESSPLTFTATATDADLPANTLTFSLAGAPAGASIDGATGSFTWTPSDAQGPGSHSLDVCVSDGTETVCETIAVTVAEVNQAPVLAAIGDRSVNELATL
ncbi:MAG: putative Ig domain-containing protein, partial [Anaerolineae bacterium]